MFTVSRFSKLTGIYKTDGRLEIKNITIIATSKGTDDFQGVANTCWFYNNPVRRGIADQAVQSNFKCLSGSAAKASSCNFPDRYSCNTPNKGRINSDLTEFINHHCPPFSGRLFSKQMVDCSSFTSTEKTGNN